ncbi:hypothetical protein JRO89_XS11G0072200 [Xanthoceras sorbifolium]|uniref:Major facilitator superfamily (MFS) profile domain-containing protein n=1 Tax=Xanthoceras sorbifolium TaxID=99658 RepID=A0ABQ8HF03_9ROSI|nr:hypothetical protein JRO89_XS11G0072200 [Xanthoceras sorbifolium]
MGRKSAYGMTFMFVVICSIASGLSFGKDPKAVMATLCFFRFWLGFDIGGDYPLSATITSECTNKKTRGAFIADAFAMEAVVIAGMEFLVNTYGLFCITLVTKLLGRIYFHEDGPYTLGSFPDNVVAAVNGVALYGTLAGQLFVG